MLASDRSDHRAATRVDPPLQATDGGHNSKLSSKERAGLEIPTHHNHNNASQFKRGEKASLSVRLRKSGERLEHSSAEGKGVSNGKKDLRVPNYRHSGDFSNFLLPSRMSNRSSHVMMDSPTEEEETDDWSFVTFPNGQATVQDVQASVVEDTHSHPTPIRAVTHRVPGLSLSGNPNLEKLFSIGSSSSTSSSSSSSKLMSVASKRQSCDLSNLGGTPGASSSPNRLFAPNPRRLSSDPDSSPFARNLLERDSKRRFLRKKSDQNDISSSTKRCSGEFHFVTKPVQQEKQLLVTDFNGSSEQHNTGKPSAHAENPPVVPQRIVRGGLGRRAATQLNINVKNNTSSYKAALYKSQEHLVKNLEERCGAELAESTRNLSVRHEVLKRGFLWQQRDKIFSRWKERLFILTQETLKCFKQDTAGSRPSTNDLLYTVKLSDVVDVELLDKRGYLTICVSLEKDGKVFLRKTEGIKEWYKQLAELSQRQRPKKASTPASSSSWMKRQLTDSSGMEHWLQKKKGLLSAFSGSSPDISKAGGAPVKSEITLDQLCDLYDQADSDKTEHDHPKGASVRSPIKRRTINRLSLMTDLDLPDLTRQFDKGFFPRSKFAMEFRSNDSGNHSISTNVSVGSTTSSISKSSSQEDRDEISGAADKGSNYELPLDESPRRRKSSIINGLQVTHV
ncbi:uncharacterized protein LOC131883592 isoform X2 [Tigriopus californicus]|uniref:uncharacterized protein LOC131883592 isoform X2 n=1 Tax=Tigriopus californicus TaxID=6832 RepID=UPI0027D9FE2E|nr:uncharacterized protein LOC131883592 isoform X2 [Tigriopus californicus]